MHGQRRILVGLVFRGPRVRALLWALRRRWNTDGILSLTAKSGEQGMAIVDLEIRPDE